MSAALKSYRPRPVPPRRQTATVGAQTLRRGGSALPAESLPQTPALSPPLVLPTPGLGASPIVRVLSQLHLVSSTLAVAMVGLTLVSYGTSVYIGRQLNQANQKLNHLQRSEQQLTTANEMLKNHIAQQVGTETELEEGKNGETGFHPPQPSSVIFLKPAQRAATVALPNQVVNRFALPQVEVPLGY
ncbi:MAG: hypothetical protein ACOYM4_00040 [Nodosilinea sp.]|jgi:hypothetical protein